MSETCQWLRGTPTSATSENENAAEVGREIDFLTVNADFACRHDINLREPQKP
jgi:hypothetical protein